MAHYLASVCSPGVFRARKTDPEGLLQDFELYLRSMKAMFVITKVTDGMERRAMLEAIGSVDMLWLFEHVGKVAEEDDFDQTAEKIRSGLRRQMNQAVLRHKLFTGFPQENEDFITWHAKLVEQGMKCDFTDYTSDKAIRDAIMLQTSSVQLRRKLLAEDSDLDETIKIGLALESAAKNSKIISSGSRTEGSEELRRLRKENSGLKASSRPLSGQAPNGQNQVHCPTCPLGKHKPGRCPGRDADCFACGEKGHFRGANVCTKRQKWPKQRSQQRLRKVDDDNSDEESSSNESVGRVITVAASEEACDPLTTVQVKPCTRKEAVSEQITFLADSGVTKTLLVQNEWQKLREFNPTARLQETAVRFRPYGTNVRLNTVGKAKVTLKSATGKKIKTTVYVVTGPRESLLGRLDAERLGILTFKPEGAPKEDVARLTSVKLSPASTEGIASGGETQREVDVRMDALKAEFRPIFHGIGRAALDPIHIHAKAGVQPVAQKQRPVAQHFMEPLRRHLDELLDADVIEGPLGSEHATGWVSNIVITAKKYTPDNKLSDIRMTLDTRSMQGAVKMVHFPIPTVEQLRHQLQGSDRFSVVDMTHSFHQLEIDEESRKLFVFTTPFGLYRFKRLVMGTPPASSECHAKFAAALAGLDGIVQIKDDIIIHGRGEEHDKRLRAFFERVSSLNITLREEKCKLGQPQVLWFGNIFNKFGMSPDPEKVKTIQNWRRPEDKAAVKSFLQTVQFSSVFMRPDNGVSYADVTAPLRELTRQNARFVWSAQCEQSFNRLKNMLTSDSVLMQYDTKRATRLYVDHGPVGVGATVAQRYDIPGEVRPQWRPVTYNSRTLKSAELGYSKVEGESLAVLSGIMANKQYLYGTKFEVVVDHKPLVPLYNNDRKNGPVRVQRHKSKLLGFNFTVVYEPGSQNPSDFPSRHPAPDREYSRQERQDLGVEETEEDEEFSVNRIVQRSLPAAVTIPMLRHAIQEDETLKHVLEDVRAGRMSKTSLISPYKPVFTELTAAGGLLLRGEQLVVPPRLQRDVISLAHEGHQGEAKTIRTLRERVWFPRLGRLTKEYVRSCLGCTAASKENRPAPMVGRPLPPRPWHTVATDFKGPIGGPRGYYYLVVVDVYSRFPEVTRVRSTSTDVVTPQLDGIWARHGVPEVVIHDGGPPFNSYEWKRYATETGFVSETITPGHPQANGLAEKMMSSLAKVIHAARAEGSDEKRELNAWLMAYRNTPHASTDRCPSELLMGRKIRVKLPCLIPESNGTIHTEIKQRQEAAQAKQKAYADKRRRALETNIRVGDKVLLRQPSSSVSPPWDPNPYTVVATSNTRITAKRGANTLSRNCEKFKKLQPRQGSGMAVNIGQEIDKDDDWITDFSLGTSKANTTVQGRSGPQRHNNADIEAEDAAPPVPLQRPKRNRRKPDRYSPS